MNLYDLTSVERDLLERVEAGEDVGALLEAAEGAVEEKLEHCVFCIRDLECTAEAAGIEASRLSARAKAKENAANHLREWVALNLGRLGRRKLETPIASVSLIDGRDKLEVDPAQVVDWPQDVYDAVVRCEFAVNKKLLRQLYEARLNELPGVKVTQGPQTISIR